MWNPPSRSWWSGCTHSVLWAHLCVTIVTPNQLQMGRPPSPPSVSRGAKTRATLASNTSFKFSTFSDSRPELKLMRANQTKQGQRPVRHMSQSQKGVSRCISGECCEECSHLFRTCNCACPGGSAIRTNCGKTPNLNLSVGERWLSPSHLLSSNNVDVAIITETELQPLTLKYFSIDGYIVHPFSHSWNPMKRQECWP